jgi:hypothetical protein
LAGTRGAALTGIRPQASPAGFADIRRLASASGLAGISSLASGAPSHAALTGITARRQTTFATLAGRTRGATRA